MQDSSRVSRVNDLTACAPSDLELVSPRMMPLPAASGGRLSDGPEGAGGGTLRDSVVRPFHLPLHLDTRGLSANTERWGLPAGQPKDPRLTRAADSFGGRSHREAEDLSCRTRVRRPMTGISRLTAREILDTQGAGLLGVWFGSRTTRVAGQACSQAPVGPAARLLHRETAAPGASEPRASTVARRVEGEPTDACIVDLPVGLGTGQLDPGASVLGERIARYSRRFESRHEVGRRAGYAGRAAPAAAA
jgi:hypothetical protein